MFLVNSIAYFIVTILYYFTDAAERAPHPINLQDKLSRSMIIKSIWQWFTTQKSFRVVFGGTLFFLLLTFFQVDSYIGVNLRKYNCFLYGVLCSCEQ